MELKNFVETFEYNVNGVRNFENVWNIMEMKKSQNALLVSLTCKCVESDLAGEMPDFVEGTRAVEVDLGGVAIFRVQVTGFPIPRVIFYFGRRRVSDLDDDEHYLTGCHFQRF